MQSPSKRKKVEEGNVEQAEAEAPASPSPRTTRIRRSPSSTPTKLASPSHVDLSSPAKHTRASTKSVVPTSPINNNVTAVITPCLQTSKTCPSRVNVTSVLPFGVGSDRKAGGSCNGIFRSSAYWIGIDEAGRGPVLGPMVYGACWAPMHLSDAESSKSKKNSDITVRNLGFADSKTLKEDERDRLFDVIRENEFIEWAVDVIGPQDISERMLRRTKYNLNAMSHDSAIGLIKLAVSLGYNITHAFLDTVGDPDQYAEKLRRIFPDINITVSKKADSIYPIVSAASICAKVCRDRCILDWQFEEVPLSTMSSAARCGRPAQEFSRDFGSGYPGDPTTKRWLDQHVDVVFGFPSVVRFSWGTVRNIVDKGEKAAKVTFEADLDDDDLMASTNGKTMKDFFSSSGKAKEKPRFRYFSQRKMTLVEEF